MTSVIYCKWQGPNNYPYVGRFRGENWDTYSRSPGGGYAKRYHYTPNKVDILEDTSSLTFKEHCAREAYWIELYAVKYGLLPACESLAHAPNWFNRFPKGVLTNTHALDGSHGIDKDSRTKAFATRKARGYYSSETFKRVQALATSSESVSKMIASRRANKPQWECSDGFKGSLGEISEHLGYKPCMGPYKWWQRNGKPNEFLYKNYKFKILNNGIN